MRDNAIQPRSDEADQLLPKQEATGGARLAQFFIPAAASLQERRPRTLKCGETFAVFDHNGDVLSGPGSPEGLYHRDTRFLSHFYLTVDGARPMLLSSTLRDDNATLTCDLTNPDLYDRSGALALSHDLIHVRRSRFLWNGTCFERLAIRNFDVAPRRVRLTLAFAADFADLFEVRGTERKRRGTVHPAKVEQAGVLLAYTGLDRVQRTTWLRFEPRPARLDGNHAVFEIDLDPRRPTTLFVEIRCDEMAAGEPPRRAFFIALRDARRALRSSASRAASLATSNETFNEAIRRSISDLTMLTTDTEHGPYPYAGIPWFSTVFGRDALITALQMLWLDPALARGVLRYLAAHQATATDPAADAEPGKILHEVRHGEMARLREVPFGKYYGSVDSTPLFVILAGAYLERTGDIESIRRLWPNVEAAIGWMTTSGDQDGDGFVEYSRMTAEGLVNQGWKDSHDSVFHADGSLARGPVAIAEVQAYAYGAWRAAGHMAAALGQAEKAAAWRARAEGLRRQFDRAFFDEDLGSYVLALDGDKKPCRVLASNAGHALFTGIAYPERAKTVATTLMQSVFFSGWGIRTVASTEARYNPMSYHNGSVWPHDNALIAAGLARYGLRHETARVFEGLYAASTYIDLRRLPELFCGFSRQRSQGPTFYPVACAPQAWAAAAPLSLVQSCLGLCFDVGARQVMLDRPILPKFLDELVVRRLSLGDDSVDLALRRFGSEVVVTVLSRRGDVSVVART
ncbi:MAG TPA: amylo-alpha-1,6-glucosidase [Pseudorhodoplanes sp.]|jgi:glycogen debranching enzyme|nr:amylo-alpha-1,6-glucosidase [Pseudorhodoplanes sp.]